MHAIKRVKTLTASATAKLTGEEEKLVRARAMECGLTKSEWCRQVLLEATKTSPDSRMILTELMALRTVFVRLYSDSLQGLVATDERLKFILDSAETLKFKLADDRIEKNCAKARTAQAKLAGCEGA